MTARLTETTSSPAAWTGAQMRVTDEWIHRLSEPEIAELEAALARVKAREIELPSITQEHFDLPALSPIIDRWVHDLEDGRGFLLVKGLPIDRYSEQDASTIYWGIGQHMGVPVSQNAAGDLLGNVQSTGRSISRPRRARRTGLGSACRTTPTAPTSSVSCVSAPLDQVVCRAS